MGTQTTREEIENFINRGVIGILNSVDSGEIVDDGSDQNLDGIKRFAEKIRLEEMIRDSNAKIEELIAAWRENFGKRENAILVQEIENKIEQLTRQCGDWQQLLKWQDRAPSGTRIEAIIEEQLVKTLKILIEKYDAETSINLLFSQKWPNGSRNTIKEKLFSAIGKMMNRAAVQKLFDQVGSEAQMQWEAKKAHGNQLENNDIDYEEVARALSDHYLTLIDKRAFASENERSEYQSDIVFLTANYSDNKYVFEHRETVIDLVTEWYKNQTDLEELWLEFLEIQGEDVDRENDAIIILLKTIEAALQNFSVADDGWQNWLEEILDKPKQVPEKLLDIVEKIIKEYYADETTTLDALWEELWEAQTQQESCQSEETTEIKVILAKREAIGVQIKKLISQIQIDLGAPPDWLVKMATDPNRLPPELSTTVIGKLITLQ